MSMAIQRKPRMTLSLDEQSMDLLERLQAFTGMSPAQTIQKIFPTHLGGLHTYLIWLQQLPKDTSLKSMMGPHLLHTPGVDLIARIKEIDPTYVPK